MAFSDSGNSEELSENEKYAIRVGSYDENGTYTRNSFEISLYTKDFKKRLRGKGSL